MKYVLKNAERKTLKMVCLRCGKEETSSYASGLPRPNTGTKITKGFLGPQPGSWLGCKLGSHNFYFEHEVVPA